MNQTTFLLLRLGAATSMLGHGLVRLPKLKGFSQWMTGTFRQSLLPEAMVRPFSYALPVAEFVIGLLLFAGLFTRAASTGGAVVMLLLLFGTCLIENWEALPSQLIHLAFFAVLLQFIDANVYAADHFL